MVRSGWAAFSTLVSDGRFVVKGTLTDLASGAIPSVGVEAYVTHAFSLKDTREFAQLTGDNNPLHVNANFARKHTAKNKPVVQGLLSASLFATIFGRIVPGAMYVKQELRWRAPLLVDEQVTARIRVTKIRRRFIECETVCTNANNGVVIVDGFATLLLPTSGSTTSASNNGI